MVKVAPRLLLRALLAWALIVCLDTTWAQEAEVLFTRGDANADGSTNIADAIYLLGCGFLGTECPSCRDSGDVNDDGEGNITDPVYLLNYLFVGGPPPPAPHETCGIDPTADAIDCVEYLPCLEPEVPRGAHRLLVERFSRAGERSFYTMELDGSLVAPFPGIPADAQALFPSPDGLTIAYLRRTPDDFVHIWLMDRDGASRGPILEGEHIVEHLTWSPDGARVAFEGSTLDDTSDIWVMNADGTAGVNLTPDVPPGVVFDRHPSWSPDGGRIAFTSNRTGTTRPWLMGPDGSNPVEVVPSTLEALLATPAWSPDGVLIAFGLFSASEVGIAVAGPDGSGYRTFPIGGEPGPPAWSPDGRLLYATNIEGNHEIYAQDPSGGGAPVNLTHHRDHDVRATALRHADLDPWLGFGPPVPHETGVIDCPGMAAGDVNADGLEDLVLLDPAGEQVRILLGKPGGTFEPLGGLNATGDQRALVVEDVSRDGVDDIVVLGPGALSVYRGSTGGPGLPTTHEFEAEGHGLAAADFDSDGSMDLAAVHDRGGAGLGMRIFGARSDDGTLVAILDVSTDFLGSARACASDATGEGAADVVVVSGDPHSPLVLIPGHGDISFGLALPAGHAWFHDPSAIPLSEDLDGDRRAEMVLLVPGLAKGLAVLRSTGTDFEPVQAPEVRGSDIGLADADRDGDADLLLAESAPAAVSFLRNRGDARFGPPVEIAPAAAAVRLLATDLNGDDWPDLAYLDAGGTLSVQHNTGR